MGGERVQLAAPQATRDNAPVTTVQPSSLLTPTPTAVDLPIGAIDSAEERAADEAAREARRRLAGGGAAGESLPPIDVGPTVSGLRVQRASLIELGAAAFGYEQAPASEGGFIVEDNAETLRDGQMRKSVFLERVRRAACDTADAELRRVGHSTDGCPYVERWLARYARRSAAHVERVVRRYAPEAAFASSAAEYIPHIQARVARSAAEWARTGQMPDDLPEDPQSVELSGVLDALVSIGKAAGAAFGALFKKRPGATGAESVSGAELVRPLGSGRPLESGTRARMESTFGHSFADVRIHADDAAAEANRAVDARAFTVGSHIAFGANEYHPGSLVGDALLAHELAHVVQQRGADLAGPVRLDPGGTEEIEREADAAAVGAVAELWDLPADVSLETPRVRSGLQLARCSEKQPPKKPVKIPLLPHTNFRLEQPLTREQALARRDELLQQSVVPQGATWPSTTAQQTVSLRKNLEPALKTAGYQDAEIDTAWTGVQRAIASAWTTAYRGLTALQRMIIEMHEVADRLYWLALKEGAKSSLNEDANSLLRRSIAFGRARIAQIVMQLHEEIVTGATAAIGKPSSGAGANIDGLVRTAIDGSLQTRVFNFDLMWIMKPAAHRRVIITSLNAYREQLAKDIGALAATEISGFYSVSASGIEVQMLTAADLQARLANAPKSATAGHLRFEAQSVALMQQMLGQIHETEATSPLAHRLVTNLIGGAIGGHKQHRDVVLKAVSSSEPMVPVDSFASNKVDPAEIEKRTKPPVARGLATTVGATWVHILGERQYDAINIATSRKELEAALQPVEEDARVLLAHKDCPASLREKLMGDPAKPTQEFTEAEKEFAKRVRPGFLERSRKLTLITLKRYLVAHYPAIALERLYYSEQGLPQPVRE